MTKTLGIGQIPPPLLRPAHGAGTGPRRVGVGHVGPGYLPLAVDANVIPPQASFEFATAAGVFSTRSASRLDAAFERRHCNGRLKQPVHQFQ
jgi:hypothetical protein